VVPRLNPPRLIGGEEAVARRVRFEREKRGWTTEGLAQRMTEAGCPITQSAIWRVENGQPRRRITHDEALAYAAVFEIPIAELSTPIQAVAEGMATLLLEDLRRQVDALVAVQDRIAEILRQHQVAASMTDDPKKIVAQGRRELSEYLIEVARDLWNGADDA
jgi:transcriptional regulator with XRE-family HTH domain